MEREHERFFERVRTLVSAWFPRSAPCVCTRGPRKRAVENPPRGLVEWVRRNEGRPLIGDRQSVGRQPACHTVVCARVFLPSFSRSRVASYKHFHEITKYLRLPRFFSLCSHGNFHYAYFSLFRTWSLVKEIFDEFQISIKLLNFRNFISMNF